jgi:hypothetical protein
MSSTSLCNLRRHFVVENSNIENYVSYQVDVTTRIGISSTASVAGKTLCGCVLLTSMLVLD